MKTAREFSTVNPVNNETLKTYNHLSENELDAILKASSDSFEKWRLKTPEQRQSYLVKLAVAMASARSEMARMMSLEMGKPLAEAEAELKKCEATIKYYAEKDPGILAPHFVPSTFKKSAYVACPTGTIFGVMPWNFPVWQIIRFCLPTIFLGNVTITKPSDQTAGTSEILQRVFDQAFGDLQVFKIVLLDNDLASKTIGDPRVKGVSFTGSTKTGKLIAARAAEFLKKSVLELGGADASMILADADMKIAAEMCVKSRLQNNGQSCVSSKRFFVPRQKLDEFLAYFSAAMKTYKIGDPLVVGTKLGPLATEKFKMTFTEEWQRLTPWFEKSEVLYQESDLPKGAYFSPRWAVMKEHSINTTKIEMFCPAAQIFPYDTENEMFAMVNSSPYGLGSSIYTSQPELAWKLAQENVDCGMVSINEIVKSDPALPFGGVKESGWGRELSDVGIFEFSNLKTIGEA